MVTGKKVVSFCVSQMHFRNARKALAVKITKKVAHEAQKKRVPNKCSEPDLYVVYETYPLKNAKGSHA